MGGKLHCKMVHEPNHSTSITLLSKYARNSTYGNLQFDSSVNSTHVWKLYCKSSKFFNEFLYRVAGNGKRINMWHDIITGSDPLEGNEDIVDIREWLLRAGKTRLYDLLIWDSQGECAGWDLNGIPDWLTPQKNLLIELLEGSTPEHRQMRDSWACGLSGT